MDVVVILILILLTGLFAMAEMALLTSRKTALENEAKKGDSRAKLALKLKENPDNLLSTVQFGFTLMSILTGMLSGDKIVEQLTLVLERYNFFGEYTHKIATVLVVMVVTYLTLVIGELVPKKIGLSRAIPLSKVFAAPMNLLTKIAYPFIVLLSTSTKFITNLLGIKKKDYTISEDEIKAIIQEGADSGSIDNIEHEIVNNVFSLGDRKVSSLMTPRYDIEWIDINSDYNEIIDYIFEKKHSLFPVCNDDLDNILGVIYFKDIFTPKGPISIEQFKTKITKPLYLLENIKAYKALDKIKENKVHQALVLDEYGVVQGIVSVKDFLTVLVGDTPEQNEEESYIIKRNENSWFIDGAIPFADFVNEFELSNEDMEDHDEYNTLAGMILHQMGEIPVTGKTIDWKNFTFEIADMDQNRIDKILVTRNIENEDYIDQTENN